MSFEPRKTSEGINPHVRRGLIWYISFSGIFAICFLAMMTVFPSLSPDDPELELRYLIGKTAAFIVGAWAILGMIHVWEIITNGNLIGRVLSDAIASAIFLSALIIGGCLLFIYL